MRFLEFIHRVDEAMLLEAAKDRYVQMFQNIPDEIYELSSVRKDKISDIVKNTMETMQRSDRITWALRLTKYYILDLAKTRATAVVNEIVAGNETPSIPMETARSIIQYADSEETRLANKSGLSMFILRGDARNVTTGTFLDIMRHYLGLPIQEIQDYQFSWQSADEILNTFADYETVWKETRSQEVSHGGDYEEREIEPIIKFPDGSAWFDLKRTHCSIEANAMGHCGNSAGWEDTHTILSYRTPVPGTNRWVPHMTFILDKEHGTLGEMKGRGNEKPTEKYHPYIIELLKKPYIKGFGNGGYEPENNFNINDLPTEQAKALKEMKPGFRTIADQYEMGGMTENLVARIIDLLGYITQEKITYDEKTNYFYVEWFSSLSYAVELLGGEVAEWVNGVLNGSVDHTYDYYVADYEIEDLFDNLDTVVLERIGLYTERKYGDEYEEDEYDFNITSDIVTVLDKQNDEIIDNARSAIANGMEYGSQAEMSESFNNWLSDVSGNYSAKIKHQWDEGKAYLIVGENSIVNFASNDEDMDKLAEDSWKSALEIEDMDSPDDEWYGYDGEIAKERFMEVLDENILPIVDEKEA